MNFSILLIFYVIVFILTIEVKYLLQLIIIIFLKKKFIKIIFLGFGVNDDGFRDAAITATTLWQNLGYPKEECRQLLNQFRRFDQKLKPYDLGYDLNSDTPELW